MLVNCHDYTPKNWPWAGSSGLIAAKTFLHDHPPNAFAVTVFEKSPRIGGLWSTDWMMQGRMRTNISRWTVVFSCFGWHEVSGGDKVGQFPKAKEVAAYLEGFAEKFQLREHILTECEVVKTSRKEGDLPQGAKRWTVEVRRKGVVKGEHEVPETETHHFDDLIIATGFFAIPKVPKIFRGNEDVKVVHSTQFRSLRELLTPEPAGTKILVVGGSMSGTEVASAVAMEISSEINSPPKSDVANVGKYTVQHVMKRPFWVLPYFLPAKPVLENGDMKIPNPTPSFLPLDLVMYDLNRRPPGQLKNYSGRVAPKAALQANSRFEAIIGSDQSEFSPKHNEKQGISSLAIRGSIRSEAPWLAISDHYTEFVRSGTIIPRLGIVSNSSSNSVTIKSEVDTLEIDDLAAIILATGFQTDTSLSFLPAEVLGALSFDINSSAFPVLLDLNMTSRHNIPDLGFVGYYRGPYWGVMEMQSRLLASIFLGAEHIDNGAEEMRLLRNVATDNPKELAQFPMGDYVYLMESLRHHSKSSVQSIPLAPNDRSLTHRSLLSPVVPSRYPTGQPDITTLNALSRTIHDSSTEGKFMARAIFRALHGKWSLHRTLKSRIATYPSGTFVGSATFKPRRPTDDGYDAEYLYWEEGKFVTELGMTFTASRGYVYRYCEATDTLSAWFVKPTDGKSVDYLFHNVEIIPPSRPSTPSTEQALSTYSTSTARSLNPRASDSAIGQASNGWKACSSHLCIADTYDVEYEFWFHGIALERWKMEYEVHGPAKDYRIDNEFTRD